MRYNWQEYFLHVLMLFAVCGLRELNLPQVTKHEELVTHLGWLLGKWFTCSSIQKAYHLHVTYNTCWDVNDAAAGC